MKNLFVSLTLLVLGACGNNKIIHLYSMDKSQCITIIDIAKERFVIDGNCGKVPDSGYVRVDMMGVDNLANAVYMCWKTDTYEWEVAIDKSKIIELKLDTNRFRFSTTLPLDDRRLPTAKKFHQPYCAIFDYYSMSLIPNRGAIVEFE